MLYPTGRAFNFTPKKVHSRLLRGLSYSEERMYGNALSTVDHILPDNPDFNTEDAAYLEQFLDIPADPSTSLAERKKAIIRKLNHPGNIRGRSSQPYLEWSFQEVFPSLYVHQNLFPDGQGALEAKFPYELIGTVHKDSTVHGGAVHGGYAFHIVANHIDENRDLDSIMPNGISDLHALGRDAMRDFFYIGPSGLDPFNTTLSYPQIPASREKELRQLILHLKPAQSIGFLLVNFQ